MAAFNQSNNNCSIEQECFVTYQTPQLATQVRTSRLFDFLVLAGELVMSLQKKQARQQKCKDIVVILNVDRKTKQSITLPNIPPPPPPPPPTNGDVFEQGNNITLGEWRREGSRFPFRDR